MAYGFIKKLSLSILFLSLASSFATAQEATPIAWDDLNKYEQLALKPLQENWADLEPRQQKQFQVAAERMLTKAVRREAFNRERMKRWSNFTHDRREHVRDRYQHYREIDPERRERMRAARERFENLSEEEKQKIQERWESLPADQRPRFGHRRPPKHIIESRARRSEEERREWRERREERRERIDASREEQSQDNSESDSEKKQ